MSPGFFYNPLIVLEIRGIFGKPLLQITMIEPSNLPPLPPVGEHDLQENFTVNEYPGVFIRVKAMIVDLGILLFSMVLISSIFSSFEQIPDSVRLLSFLFIFFFYDPLFITLFGGTLGHMAIGIRVKRKGDEEQNLSFRAALTRFVFKSALGWISLITVSGNSMAIHDQIVKSVVIFYRKK